MQVLREEVGELGCNIGSSGEETAEDAGAEQEEAQPNCAEHEQVEDDAAEGLARDTGSVHFALDRSTTEADAEEEENEDPPWHISVCPCTSATVDTDFRDASLASCEEWHEAKWVPLMPPLKSWLGRWAEARVIATDDGAADGDSAVEEDPSSERRMVRMEV